MSLKEKPLSEQTVCIVGLGQIGGSIGRDLVSRRAVRRVVGVDVDREVGVKAEEMPAVDDTSSDIGAIQAGVDIVVLATPVQETLKWIPLIAKTLTGREDVLIIDVCSTKEEVVREVEEQHLGSVFVGGHPIAGSEGRGLESSVEGLFEEKAFVLVSTNQTSDGMMSRASELVIALGAKPVIMSAKEHDWLVSMTIALPHAIAVTLACMMRRLKNNGEQVDVVSGGSIASATRVAGSSPELILDLLLTNRANVCASIDEFVYRLMHVRRMVNVGDEEGLRELLGHTRERR